MTFIFHPGRYRRFGRRCFGHNEMKYFMCGRCNRGRRKRAGLGFRYCWYGSGYLGWYFGGRNGRFGRYFLNDNTRHFKIIQPLSKPVSPWLRRGIGVQIPAGLPDCGAKPGQVIQRLRLQDGFDLIPERLPFFGVWQIQIRRQIVRNNLFQRGRIHFGQQIFRRQHALGLDARSQQHEDAQNKSHAKIF